MNNISKRIAILSLFTAFALILSYVELLIPISYGLGLKIGLANIAIITILYVFSFKDALIVSVLRIIIVFLLFGNGISVLLSFSGAILSLLAMNLFKKIKGLSVVVVSIIGALFHNIGQLLAAFCVTEVPGLYFYLPVLMFGGIITGAVIGTVSIIIIKALKEIVKYDSFFKR